MSPHYRDALEYETGVRIVVDFTIRRREVLDYAVIPDGRARGRGRDVRSYDGAPVNEMHRHNRGGAKAAAESFDAGTLGEGMQAAIVEVRVSYQEMIGAWRAT
jgi:hypothetical protein